MYRSHHNVPLVLLGLGLHLVRQHVPPVLQGSGLPSLLRPQLRNVKLAMRVFGLPLLGPFHLPSATHVWPVLGPILLVLRQSLNAQHVIQVPGLVQELLRAHYAIPEHGPQYWGHLDPMNVHFVLRERGLLSSLLLP